MAVTLRGSAPIYEGLSTDDKPDEAQINAKFLNLTQKTNTILQAKHGQK